jgi:Tfp pilus assembly protein PilX
MRNQSGMALIVVMGLLVVVSLIAVGLISQVTTGTKFAEALGTSYLGIAAAQRELAKQGTPTSLTVVQGTRKSDGVAAKTIYAAPAPQVALSHGTLTGNVWRPGNCGTFYQNYSPDQTGQNKKDMVASLSASEGTITSSVYLKSDDGKLHESSLLFIDKAGENGANVLPGWTSYTVHTEFNAATGPAFGVYLNSYPNNGKIDHTISGYLFEISLINTLTKGDAAQNSTFSISQVENGNQQLTADKYASVRFDDSSLRGADGNNPFASWTQARSTGGVTPYDQWHSIDLVVQGVADGNKAIDMDNPQNTKMDSVTITAYVDGVQVLTYTDSKGKFGPGLVGLSNWSGAGWGTTSSMPSSVGFRNISVTNTTP